MISRSTCCNVLFYFLILYLLVHVDCGMTKDKMYEQITGNAACFRRLNGTHQIGCTSERGGSTGVIHLINTKSDIDWLLKNGTAAPYIPIIPSVLFTSETLLKLKKFYPEQISGIILRNNTAIPDQFSHDLKCPNKASSLNGTCDMSVGGWNPHGTGLLYEDFPFPIFIVTNDTQVEILVDCFQKFNNYDLINQRFRSLCSLELKSFMFATTNTETCVRRSNIYNNLKPVKFCDPLGDRNVWGTLFVRGNYRDNIDPNKEEIIDKKGSKVIVVATRLDDTSMFDGITPGAVSPVSGVVTLLTTAHLLKQMFNSTNVTTDENVLFFIFNGEAYDYIGSQRILYDMLKGEFPMKFDPNTKYSVPNITIDDITLFIELTQLSSPNLTVFNMNYSKTEKGRIDDFLVKMRNNAKVQIQNIWGTIPPSSLNTFLIEKQNIPGVVLADHGANFKNQYYHSIFDNVENLKYQYYNTSDEIPKNSIQYHLATVSEALAMTLFQLLAKNIAYDGPSLDTPSNLVDELLYCYLISPDCKIFKAATYLEVLQDKPLSLYVGVDEWLNSVTTVTGFTLALFLGDIIQNTTLCRRDVQVPALRYSWIQGDSNSTKGVCLRSAVNFTRARSPAFDIEGYDWSSGKYSTWTESTWQDFSVRVFLRPSAQHENITITIGIAILILSFITVYFANKKSDILFNNANSNMIGTSC